MYMPKPGRRSALAFVVGLHLNKILTKMVTNRTLLQPSFLFWSWLVVLMLTSFGRFASGQSPCNSNPCENSGQCFDVGTTFVCQCIGDFSGDRCEREGAAQVCQHNTCGNGGTCSVVSDVTVCDCQAGYTGDTCDDRVDPCSSNPCQNGGTCNEGSCTCAEGYTGATCATEIDYCSSTPCQNGGTCIGTSTGFSCTCTEGFTGVMCQTEIDHCSSNPCQNGGTCTGTSTDFSCTCTEGFTGVMCQTEIAGNEATTPTQNATQNSNQQSKNNGGPVETWVIVLVIIAAIIVVILAVVLLFMIINGKRTRKLSRTPSGPPRMISEFRRDAPAHDTVSIDDESNDQSNHGFDTTEFNSYDDPPPDYDGHSINGFPQGRIYDNSELSPTKNNLFPEDRTEADLY